MCRTYLRPGDGDPALPEPDCDIDCVSCVDECGRSMSESARGLCGGPLELRRSSSLSPQMSGDDSRLTSNCIFNTNELSIILHNSLQIYQKYALITLSLFIGVESPPFSRFLCSSLSLSAFRHFARRF